MTLVPLQLYKESGQNFLKVGKHNEVWIPRLMSYFYLIDVKLLYL